MKDISLQAGKYATEKSTEYLSEILSQAYLDGFNEGYSEAKNRVAIEFIDLGLESGTFWSSSPLKGKDGKSVLYLAYEEASKLSIPTREQWDELRKKCTWEYLWDDKIRENSVVRGTGPNGNSIEFNFIGHRNITLSFYFWVKDEKIEYKGYRHAAAIGLDTRINNERETFIFPVWLAMRGR